VGDGWAGWRMGWRLAEAAVARGIEITMKHEAAARGIEKGEKETCGFQIHLYSSVNAGRTCQPCPLIFVGDAHHR
jgi:hypothetical protein